jgi:branched-chain amino acid transport system ATP-binding protein
MLELRDVETYYGNIRALKGISLIINEGEIITLIGSNGAGKTTTLMSIAGIVPLCRGQIILDGQPIDKKPPEEIVAAGISLAPEGRRIFPGLSVLENLEMGAFLRKDHHAVKKDLAYIFDLFPQLNKCRHQAGGTLSGGEQQMLAISRALMAKPRLLLLDEPSMGLAPLMTNLIFQIIRRINADQHATIFLVEQNAYLALQLAHRGYVLENGAITASGSADKLLNEDNIKKAYLGI